MINVCCFVWACVLFATTPVDNSTTRVSFIHDRLMADKINSVVYVCYSPPPPPWLQLVHPHTHLDLLAPMPDVDMDRTRVLMLEGTLKYRDVNTARVRVCHWLAQHRYK